MPYLLPIALPTTFRFGRAAAGLLTAAVLSLGCGPDFSTEALKGESTFEPDRPEIGGNGAEVPDYTGDDPFVIDAVARFRTGNDLHKKVIVRTCSPNEGVCHAQQEYPDLSTPANFLATIEAPCNVQPGEWTSVDDRCEQPGDRFRLPGLSEREIEIAYVEHIAGESEDFRNEDFDPDDESVGLHIYLRQPFDTDRDQLYSNGQFIRNFINDEGIIEELPYANFRTRWWVLGDGDHLFAEVRNYQSDQVNALMEVGIVQGDMNRNGVHGASEEAPHALIEPGRPEASYLIGRMRGVMGGKEVVGSRMPLANRPLNISEMLALFCFVEGLPSDGDWPDMDQPINYADCSYSVDPDELNLLGEGVTWQGRVSKVLEANCSSCHSGDDADEGLVIDGEDTYDNLFVASNQKPEYQLIEPGEPAESYLWLKLTNDSEIEGYPMPFNPLTGEGKLTEAELGDIETWIVNGAVGDE